MPLNRWEERGERFGGGLKIGILEIRSDRIPPPIARIAQSVKCGEQRGGPGERSNERGGGIESRSARRC